MTLTINAPSIAFDLFNSWTSSRLITCADGLVVANELVLAEAHWCCSMSGIAISSSSLLELELLESLPSFGWQTYSTTMTPTFSSSPLLELELLELELVLDSSTCELISADTVVAGA